MVPLLFLISVTLVFSPSYLLPLAYSQEISYIPIWSVTGEAGTPLASPSGIAVDQQGNVYVADTANNRIQVFSENGTFLSKWGRYGLVNGTLRSPEGIAIDQQGNVYVADTANNRIQVFSENGTFLSKWGQYGVGNGSFTYPEGIAIDQQGNVYVADTANNRIQVFSENGTFLSVWGRHGGVAGNGTLRSPTGIAIAPLSGNVYVADTANNRIQVFSENGTFLSKWGRYGVGNGSFIQPEGIAIDQQGNVYVADTANNRIQVFSENGTFLSQWGRRGLDEEHLRSPAGVAIDSSSGNVYVADTANNRISAFTSRSPINNVAFSSEEGEIYGNDTKIKIELIYDELNAPTAIAFLGPDDMLVLQRFNNSIMRIVNGQMLDEPVLDLGNTVKIDSCMCDIAILQNDNGTSYAFLYYAKAEVAEDDGTTKVVNRLYRYDITNGKFTNPKLFLEISDTGSPGAIHHGGKLMVGPDNNIYLTTGDINDGRQTKAQNVKNSSLPDGSSSILRFTPNGDPVDGGLLGDAHSLDKYYAYGIRNSFGIDYDPLTGNIWMTDNGPGCCDELNIVRPGFNGGWNKIMGMSSFNKTFNLTDLEFFNGTGKYYDPVLEWVDPLGVTDLVFVPSDNKLGKEYDGNLFVGDFNNGYLYRFNLNQSRTGLLLNDSLSDGVANNNYEKLETAFARINGAVTDLEIGPDGLVYIVSLNGKIMRLEPIDTNETLPLIETTNATDNAPVGINGTAANNATEAGNATGATGSDGGATTGVSIVAGSTTLTDDAYEPSPVQVSVGDTITWTNDDATPHTVTSGQNGQPDGKFDSSIMAPQEIFEHTFTEAGEYPYYCALHPNTVGTVSVS